MSGGQFLVPQISDTYLPTEDRDWHGFFVGIKGLPVKRQELSGNNDRFLGVDCASLKDEPDPTIVKIVTHEGMKSRFQSLGDTGFECRKTDTGTVWLDSISGIRFDSRPKMIDYRGLELATADSEIFFPRVRSKWIDGKHGIHRKILETQVGDGIGWQKRYISLTCQDSVLQLMEVHANGMRSYRDEEGTLFLQQDLDHPPVIASEAEGIKRFQAMCDEAQMEWKKTVESVRSRFLQEDTLHGGWQLPEGSRIEPVLSSDRLKGAVFQVTYLENGDQKQFWMDLETGFTFQHSPVVGKRGFVELLYDGDLVFLLNIYPERFIPYHNWEIKADDRICTIGNRLYFADSPEKPACRIKKRSGDFQMFVLDGASCMGLLKTTKHTDLMVINKSGKALELKRIPIQ